jgi:S-(hydroxymethyl)glutathione dehydrogenase/alcohol dehydrogenase
MKAVVVTGKNEFRIEDVELAPPGDYEVRVVVKAAGLCGTEHSAISGSEALPVPHPFVAGHEGAGIVAQVGPKVTKLAVDDHVVFTLRPVCGRCDSCRKGEGVHCETSSPELMVAGTLPDGSHRFSRKDGTSIGSFLAIGCLAEETVVHEDYVVKIDPAVPLDKASLTSCAVITGAGGAINGGDIAIGDSVLVIGCGAVGLAAVQGARIAGANRIIAVDIVDSKLALASEVGATHVINSMDIDMLEAVRQIVKSVDVAIECTGVGPLLAQGFDLLRNGGTLLVIGAPTPDQTPQLPTVALPFTGRVIKGCLFGNHNPQLDIPALLEFYELGKLDLDSMITKTYSIDQFAQAYEDMPTNIKGVIVF